MANLMGRVPVGRGHQGVGVPARGGNHPNARVGRRGPARQNPVRVETGPTVILERPRPQRTVIVDSSPRPSVSVIHTSNSGRVSSVSALIVGIALAILGACIIPVNPIAGLAICGIGVLMAATAGTVYGVNYRV